MRSQLSPGCYKHHTSGWLYGAVPITPALLRLDPVLGPVARRSRFPKTLPGEAAVISALRPCPTCGAEIPADAPEGGCPGCLLESGLGLFADASVAGVDSSAIAAYSAEATAKAGSAKPDDPGQTGITDAGYNAPPNAGRTRRLRAAGRGRSRRSGRGVSRPAKESQSHSRIKSH